MLLFGIGRFIEALFDRYPRGKRLAIGVDSSFWVGHFEGLEDGVAILTKAQLYANMGKPVDGERALVRIPINKITFVSE